MKSVNTVNVYPESITIRPGEWSYLANAEICPTDAHCPEVRWYSENPCIASVNEASGYIYGIAEGTTRIYASSTDGSNLSDYLTVTVSNTIFVEAVTLSRQNTVVNKGESITICSTVYPQNATNKNLEWISSNTNIATVNNGVVSAVSKGAVRITARATDGSGKSAYCTVNVTDDVLVTSITINPTTQILKIGGSEYLEAVILPTNATNCGVTWTSRDTDIATVNPDSGLVYAQNVGTTYVYATANDGSGIVGTCTVVVQPILLQKLGMSKCEMTIPVWREGIEENYLTALIEPTNATDPTVTWKSSNSSIVTVEPLVPANGSKHGFARIRGLKKGKATITATANDASGLSVECDVIVGKEKVIVEKDGDFFRVKFEDGAVWKSIGLDLSNRQENYNNFNPPNFIEENYDTLIVEEQRYLDNKTQTFTEQQIALLYLLDPLGIEYYIKYQACKNMTLEDGLAFKDRLYKEIFGVYPKPFVLSDDGKRVDVTWECNRVDVFTDSELIFGEHNIVDMIDLAERATEIIIYIIDETLPESKQKAWLVFGLKAAKALLFASSIKEAISDVATDFIDTYIDENSDDEVKLMEWPNPLLEAIYEFKEGLQDLLNIPNIKDIEIYNKIARQDNYIVEFVSGSHKLFMDEIIELCS